MKLKYKTVELKPVSGLEAKSVLRQIKKNKIKRGVLRQIKKNKIKRGVVKHLIRCGTSTLSEIMYGITTCYVSRSYDNYFVREKVSRHDMKEALKDLVYDGLIECTCGHKWKITKFGIEQANIL